MTEVQEMIINLANKHGSGRESLIPILISIAGNLLE